MTRALAVTALWLALAGCSTARLGNSAGGGDNSVDSTCRWPSTLDDAGPGGCRAGRALIECSTWGGVTCDCVSDQATCDCDPSRGWTCQDLCTPGQYAIACGAAGGSAGPAASPPDGCSAALLTPGGVAYYCCPCG